MSQVYHWCIVPQCKSTSMRNAEKTFIQVPADIKIKKKWFVAIRRDFNGLDSKKSTLFVCEDHFNLKEDMENYMEWKIMRCRKIMKKNVLPHIFDCQPDRKRTCSNEIPRSAAMKRQKLEVLKEIFAENVLEEEKENDFSINELTTGEKNEETQQASQQEQEGGQENQENQNPNDLHEEPRNAVECSTASVQKENRSRGVSVRPHFRSKETQTIPLKTSVRSTSPIEITRCDKETQVSPSKFPQVCLPVSKINTSSDSDGSENSEGIEESDSENLVVASSSTSTFSADEEENIAQEFSKLALTHTTRLICEKPRRYLGLNKECFFIIDYIEHFTGLSKNSIYLTLQKIKTNYSFGELGDAYGFSESFASKTFAKSLPLISVLMREFITHPPKSKIQELLPLPFRARCSTVQYVIDCFEIEIEKPSDSVKQSLTWSEYKKGNTLKYLVSSTPDGIVNFVSKGFGGRTSDLIIVQHSGFLDTIESGAVIMADRGFKHVANFLTEKGCRLIRPPSVGTNEKLSKSCVLETKRIASLRIHIERLIRRFREFRFLKPHSCINNKLVPIVDFAVIVAAGLINIQGPLIK